jgi:Zn-dependent protease
MQSGGIHLFNFRGHSVSVSFTYLILILFYMSNPGTVEENLVAVFAVTFSILWHELGHAFAFQRYNCGPSEILLHGFGGVTSNAFAGHLPRNKAMMVSLAGPLAGLILGIPLIGVYYLKLSYGPGAERTLLDVLLFYMIVINITWSVFNLFPIWPMDGGMIFRQFISKWSFKSYYYTGWLSIFLLAPLIILMMTWHQTFMAIVLAFLAFECLQLVQQTKPDTRQ